MKNQTKKQKIAWRILIIALTSFIIFPNLVSAEVMFNFEVTGLNEKEVSSEYILEGLSVPVFSTIFETFSVSLVDIYFIDYYPGFTLGEYTFNIALLDSSKSILSEKQASVSFFILTNPPTYSNQTVLSAVFDDATANSAEFVRVSYEGKVLLEERFKQKVCNSNSICENVYTGYPEMFETTLSCPNDCPKYGYYDGTCDVNESASSYSLNDGICDPDCYWDVTIDSSDNFTGECLIPRWPSGLISYWSFNNNANPAKDDYGLNNGALFNGISWASSGKAGGALNLDGVNDYATLGGVNSFNGLTKMSMCAWVYTNQFGQYWPGIAWSRGTRYFGLVADSSLIRKAIYFQINTTFGLSERKPNVDMMTQNNWYHICGTWDGSNGTVKLYYNGTEYTGGTTKTGGRGAILQDDYLKLGWDDYFSNRFFNGKIDEVLIFNTTLSASEVKKIYDAGFAGKGIYQPIISDCIDRDKDGAGTANLNNCNITIPDCDDYDSQVNPSANEICGNYLDDNCNGEENEGCGGVCDSDSDGFLDSSLFKLWCSIFGETNDCDDNDFGINPNATEICNGLDDDCDGIADEGEICCDNGILDDSELGIDCGGLCSISCCENGLIDEELGEEGIDCGGNCNVSCLELPPVIPAKPGSI